MSQMGGGLRWHGVSKTGSTATSRIMNAAKAEREKANRSAPKVGSASVTDGDDWLAVGNPSPASSASSGGRQAAVPPLLSPRSSGRQASSSPQTFEPEVRDSQLQWMYRQERGEGL